MASEFNLARFWRVGYAADPAIDVLLDKSKIAQIRVRQLDGIIYELKTQLEIAELEKGMLVEEYKVRTK